MTQFRTYEVEGLFCLDYNEIKSMGEQESLKAYREAVERYENRRTTSLTEVVKFNGERS